VTRRGWAAVDRVTAKDGRMMDRLASRTTEAPVARVAAAAGVGAAGTIPPVAAAAGGAGGGGLLPAWRLTVDGRLSKLEPWPRPVDWVPPNPAGSSPR
jgi:hypothetical protein